MVSPLDRKLLRDLWRIKGQAAAIAEQLAVDEDCPCNCSGRAACVDGACNCPAAYAGDDCSIEVSACPGDCSGHGACVYGACHCERGYAGGSCQFVEQLCSSNCSGHGICSPSGRCA